MAPTSVEKMVVQNNGATPLVCNSLRQWCDGAHTLLTTTTVLFSATVDFHANLTHHFHLDLTHPCS